MLQPLVGDDDTASPPGLNPKGTAVSPAIPTRFF